jgi:hypothetical protein
MERMMQSIKYKYICIEACDFLLGQFHSGQIELSDWQIENQLATLI